MEFIKFKEFTAKEKNDLLRFNYLLQPIRLKKILSSDNQYLENYPTSLNQIVEAYWVDLIKGNQFSFIENLNLEIAIKKNHVIFIDKLHLKMTKKSIKRILFIFVIEKVSNMWNQRSFQEEIAKV